LVKELNIVAWLGIKGTVLLQSSNSFEERKALAYAAGILNAGGLVAFPTETVYGLGANAFSSPAVAKIFRAKKRPADNPLIVHIAKMEQMYELASTIPPEALLLGQKFWPGPLTIILPKKKIVPDITTAGLPSIAIRIPSHPLALKLIRAAGLPLAAPSANLSGRPSPTKAKHVLGEMAGRINAIIDGGDCIFGLESTVLSLVSTPPSLLRPGGVTLEMLESCLKKEILDLSNRGKDENDGYTPPSPGMKYRHYAPTTPLYLVEGKGKLQRKQIISLYNSLNLQGCKVGLLLSEEMKRYFPTAVLEVLGPREDHHLAARRLFQALRRLDELKLDIIIAEGVNETGLGRAIMNRLRKAATRIFNAEKKV
jgi:L-threonylcarbamoyladenylate synthase